MKITDKKPKQKEEREFIEIDEKKYILIGLFVIGLIFGGIVIWAFTAKIDTVVPAPGKVVVKTYKKPVEYKEWGTVTGIFVKEGDYVEKGDILIELEKLQQDTDYKVLKSNYYNLLAQRDRLLSEKYGYSTIKFSEEFISYDDEKAKKEIIKNQTELFKKRKKSLEDEIKVIDERIAQDKAKIEGLQNLLQIKQKMLKHYEDRLSEEKDLLKSGLTSKTVVLDLEEKRDTLKADVENIKTEIMQTSFDISSLEKQKQLKLGEYSRDVATQLQDVLAKLSEIKPRFIYAKEKVKKAVIKAPASGQVIGLKITSKGQVIKPGDVIMFIVPHKDKIFMQVRVNPTDRDKVKKGQLVDLRFPAFVSIGANVVEGKVTYVASDTLFDQVTKHEYYEAHIELTEKGKEQLKRYNFQLIPGMPVTAFIKVEKITPIEYILQPIIVIFETSFISN